VLQLRQELVLVVKIQQVGMVLLKSETMILETKMMRIREMIREKMTLHKDSIHDRKRPIEIQP